MIHRLANNADDIQVSTAQTLEGIDAQIAENQVDLPAAVAANQQQGTDQAVKGLAAMNGMYIPLYHFTPLTYPALLGITVTSKAAAVQTLSRENIGTNAAVATSVATAKASKATAASSSATAKAAAAAKKGKNNNNKRESSLKWAKRALLEESI